jgi:hypothetical protein
MPAPLWRSGSTLAAGALGIGVLAGMVGAVAAASQSGSPVRIGGVERGDVSIAVFAALIAAAFLLYVCALLLLRSGSPLLGPVLILALAIQLTPLAGPLLISRDVYSYWAYGRIAAIHEQNPYLAVPGRFPSDPATHAAAWRRQTSVYGPTFAVVSAAVADAAGASSEIAAFSFRAIAACAGFAATLLAAIVARRKAYAAAFVGWNPVIALSFAGGGHNDAWMVALVLGALALVARKRDVGGGMLWVLAVAVKAAALPILLPELLRSRRGLKVGAVSTALVIAAVSTTAFGTAWLTSLWQLPMREARAGLPARLEQLGAGEAFAHTITYLALAAGGVWIARRALRGQPTLALGASLLVATSAWVMPWYSTWPIALAAVEEDAFAQAVALGLALYLLPDRVPV